MPAVGLGEEARLVLRPLVRDERGARIGLDARGVAHDEPDADRGADHEDHDAADEALVDRRPGEAGRDARRERVDRRAEHPDPAAKQQDRSADERVIAGGDHHRDDEGVERQALLRHPEGRAADREHDHQDRDEQALAAAQARHDLRDSGLDRARLHRHAEEAADDEDEERHVDGAEQLAASSRR